MDSEAAALAGAIGQRVRQERLTREWTLEHLAEAAGVSRRMVINVEQGATNPSVGILLRLSDALGVGLPSLVAPPESAEATLVRRGEQPTLWRGPAGGRGVLVVGTAPPDVVELWDWVLAGGEDHRSEAHAVGTRELMHVLEGHVTVMVAESSFNLAEGDALEFAGDAPHVYANPTSRPARFSLAVYEPGVGAGSRTKGQQ